MYLKSMGTFHKHILKEISYLKQYIWLTTIYSGGSQALKYTGFGWLPSIRIISDRGIGFVPDVSGRFLCAWKYGITVYGNL